jgi:hypothetical protein
MGSVDEVKWGSYRDTEGPLYKGPVEANAGTMPVNTDSDRIVYCTMSVESGNYAAVNMYDRGLVSLGLIQFIEGMGQFSVSGLLGALALRDRGLLQPLDDYCRELGVYFVNLGINGKPLWRFRYKDARGTVDTTEEQVKLFYLNASGQKGGWDPPSVAYAKRWALVFGSLWSNSTAQSVQRAYTADRLLGFATAYSRPVLASAPATAQGGVFRAAYLSFAVNNPKWASDALKAAVADQGNLTPWSTDWVIHMLKYLTFNPKVSFYPARYQALRPALEKVYGLDLPDFASELAQWKSVTGHRAFSTPKEAQEALIALGYDLGPQGADGIWGKKSQEALLLFEQQKGMADAEGKLTPAVSAALEKSLAAKAV